MTTGPQKGCVHKPGPVRPKHPPARPRLSHHTASPLHSHLHSNAVTMEDVVRLEEKDELRLLVQPEAMPDPGRSSRHRPQRA